MSVVYKLECNEKILITRIYSILAIRMFKQLTKNMVVIKEDYVMVHLVYCDNEGKNGQKVYDKIVEGTKTMIVRGAAGRKIPHSRVFEGETLYFMEKGTSKITAMATVISVENYIKLTDEESIKILDENQNKLNLTDKQRNRWHKKCLCLIEFKDVKEIAPLEFAHQGNMDDWLIIEKIEDVVVGSSIPYNYEKSRF